MPTPAAIIDMAASLMNDTALTVYTHAAQLPYLQMALDELQEEFELNNIAITNQASAAVTVVAGGTTIGAIDGIGTSVAPNYPSDLAEIQQLWTRLSGSSDPYIPIGQAEFLPNTLVDIPIAGITVWAWVKQQIKFIPSTTAQQVKIDYIAKLFPDNITAVSALGIINARSFLQYRTAALCSQFIGENPTRAQELNTFAEMARDRAVGINVKGKQSNPVRRRPFMASYKRRTMI